MSLQKDPIGHTVYCNLYRISLHKHITFSRTLCSSNVTADPTDEIEHFVFKPASFNNDMYSSYFIPGGSSMCCTTCKLPQKRETPSGENFGSLTFENHLCTKTYNTLQEREKAK